jgi:hypothetical protein
MLDYHARFAVLHELRTTIGATFAGDPSLAARVSDLLNAVATDEDAALLGACIDQLVAHAASDGVELDLLETAADLWTRGVSLYDQLGACRQGIEAALKNPTDPGSLANLQTAINGLDGLRGVAQQIAAEASSLKDAISPLPHLGAHPRQQDVPDKNWTWRDVFPARRTDAFVRAVFDRGRGGRGPAFAFGVLSGYAANVAGSAYLGAVVGGPRRAHRFRDRLARNTVGASLHEILKTPATADLAKRLRYTGPTGAPALPSEIASILQAAFAAAYPDRTPPDLDLGFSRMLRHLELLDVFKRPALPEPPPLIPAQVGDPTGDLTIMSDDLSPPGVGVDLDPDMTPSSPSTSDSGKSHGDICIAILVIAISVGLALLIYCVGQWTTGKECKPSDFFDTLQGSEEPDPRAPTNTTQGQLQAMSTPEIAAHIIQELFNMQMLLWQAFDLALGYLAVTGFVYPDALLMPSPLYQAFLKVPSRPAWPHRPEANPQETYHLDPTSPIEQPAASSPSFPANASPIAFVAGTQDHAAEPVARTLLAQVLRRQTDTQNYDLDADRGFRHPCWSVAPGTSIDDPVLSVDVLPYTAD